MSQRTTEESIARLESGMKVTKEQIENLKEKLKEIKRQQDILESYSAPLEEGDRVEFIYHIGNNGKPMTGKVVTIARGSGAGNNNIPVFRVFVENPAEWYRNDLPINFHPRQALKLIGKNKQA